jgi:SAM-dependent methyltransferase
MTVADAITGVVHPPQVRGCPQCAALAGRRMPHYSVPPWQIVQCAECDFVYLENAPRYEQLAEELAWEKTFAAETQRRQDSYPVISAIERITRWRLHLRRGKGARLLVREFGQGRVLDIGCERGYKIPPPFIPFGIEISEALAREADDRMRLRGGRAICAPALKGIAEFPDRYFSGVVLSSLLEHEVNPKPLLQQAARVLVDTGKAYVKVPNFGGINRRVMGLKWCGFRHPDHVNYFTLASLRRMASDCGFRMRLVDPISLPFNDSINAILAKA